MSRKSFWILIICIVSGIGLSVIGYFAIDEYLQSRFGPNTWIGDIYCTGKTVDEVNRELLEHLNAPVVTVTDCEGKTYSFDLSEADYHYDYTQVLTSFQRNQANAGWLENLKSRHEVSLGDPAFFYNDEKLRNWWRELPIVQAETQSPVLELRYDEKQGYLLFSTLEGHLNVENGLNDLIRAVDGGQTQFSLEGEQYYYDYQMNVQQRIVYEKWQDLKAMEQCGLIYDMGAEQITFDEARMAGFIAKDRDGNPKTDRNGKFYYDQNAVYQYMEELCAAYRTYGVYHDFQSSRGEIVQVYGNTYGTQLDQEAEQAFLWEYLSSDETRLAQTTHTPVYLHETPVHGLNDIGDTYIEVDMGAQKIYFYQEGELIVSSDVVTGNLKTGNDTPEGVNAIYSKAKNTVLRGPGYVSRVKRWMAVYKGIGLHDASWRNEFGGEIYKTDGSHGCVNLPSDTANIIYDNAEIGTPVIMYY